jgi:hypothetical protein
MGAQTKQVGGGSATPMAGNFNNFLNQQLMGGGGPSPQQQQLMNAQQHFQNMGGQFGNRAAGMLNNQIMQQQSNQQQPGQQSSAFQNGFNAMMGGNVNDISGAGGAIQQYFQNPSNQFTNQYQNQQFQGANLSQLPTNFGQGQTGMADLSGFGNAAQSNFNPMQQLRGVGDSQFNSMLMNMIQSGGQMQGQSGFGGGPSAGPGVELAPGMSYGDAYNTLGQDPLMERNRMKAVADQRARFGAEGAGALGTGAQFAEGNLNAELLAQDASMRRGQSMQLMGQDLAERSAGANVGLQGRGQDLQGSIAGMQGALQGAQNMNQFNTTNLGNLLSAAGQGRGQDFNSQLGMRGQDLSQLGMGLDQSMFNAGQQNNMQGNMLNAALQNQGMGNSFGLGAAGLNNQAMQNNNQNAMGMAGMQNNFNLQNAGSNAQFGNAAQQGNANFFQNMINQGMGMNQLGNQNTMGMLNQLFGGFGQANALGTPQAQMIQQPSQWGQLLNAGLTLGGGFLGGPRGMQAGNMFGQGMTGGYTPGMNVGQMPTSLFGGANFGIPQQMGSFGGGMPMFGNANFGIGR